MLLLLLPVSTPFLLAVRPGTNEPVTSRQLVALPLFELLMLLLQLLQLLQFAVTAVPASAAAAVAATTAPTTNDHSSRRAFSEEDTQKQAQVGRSATPRPYNI